jgi:hypothetical protein
MIGRDSQQEDHFNLLPFIAILMCVLGTELLVTMSMAALSLGAGATEGWVPAVDSTRTTKTPVLVEWDGRKALIHRGKAREELAVALDKTPPPAIARFLDEMASQRETAYVLFAVRPGGFENYYQLAQAFRERKIAVGFEPIEQNKAVRLEQGGAR